MGSMRIGLPTGAPDGTDHSFSMPSSYPIESSSLPSGLNLADAATPTCPFHLRSRVPRSASHKAREPSSPVVASIRPSWLKVTSPRPSLPGIGGVRGVRVRKSQSRKVPSPERIAMVDSSGDRSMAQMLDPYSWCSAASRGL
jgi:hypothetical protein